MKEFITRYWLEVIFGTIIAVLSKVVINYNKKFSNLKCSYSAMESVMLELSKSKMLDIYHLYKHDKCIPLYIKESFEGLYLSYKTLGGNGIMTGIHDSVMQWEIEED